MSKISAPMTAEATAAVFERYVAGDGDDLSMLAEDVVFRDMATGEAHHGRDGVARLFARFYQEAFEASAEEVSRVVGPGRAAAEWLFVGRHIGAFDGVPATGKAVRVPLVLVYDIRDDVITDARIYFAYRVFHTQVQT
jgi:steroid delta-isomerase-like uncharacterized protein